MAGIFDLISGLLMPPSLPGLPVMGGGGGGQGQRQQGGGDLLGILNPITAIPATAVGVATALSTDSATDGTGGGSRKKNI